MNTKYMFAILSVCLLVVACTPKTPIVPPGGAVPETTQGIKKFSSTSELRDFLKAGQEFSGYNTFSYDMGFSGGLRKTGAMMESISAAPTASMDSSGASDYSQTNIQVEGVDEADFVKNDAKYIYVISGNQLVIVNAYPAENAEIVSKTELKGTPQQLFLSGDRLVVFTWDWEDVPMFSPFDFMPRQSGASMTHAIVYDVSDRENPDKLFDYNLRGGYFQSRMIGDWVYFVVQEGAYYHPLYMDTPVIKEGKTTVMRPEIYYFDNPENNYNFNTIASLNIQGDEDSVNAKTFMLGYSNTMYASEGNIYISYQKNPPYYYYQNHEQDRFYEVVAPMLPSDVEDQILSIKDDDGLSAAEKWDQISSIMMDMYNDMDEEDKQALVEDIQKEIDNYERKLEVDRAKTVIHKIGIDKGEIDYDTKGEVPGYLLNQFSMDEFNGDLRVATNVQLWNTKSGSESFNNVYVLGSDLEIKGKLEGLAEGESIYSTRFLGDRLYMVTFKRIDPLFVISLADPENPEVLGKLKIPGYSDYLHPYDEDHIIGIGKETEGNEWGGVSTAGVKIALFDVSDVENPREVDKVEIGKAGSDSEVLRDHKALLFNREKNILVIPVREIKSEHYYQDNYWKQDVWQGAYVFGIDPETGFEKKGKVSHYDGTEEESWYWSSPYDVKRSLYMDDVLYTISSKLIKMNQLDNIDDEIGTVKLPGENGYYDYPRLMAGTMGIAQEAVKMEAPLAIE